MSRFAPSLLVFLALGCNHARSPTTDAPPPAADWTITLAPTTTAATLSPTLLGQYDLDGALFHYDHQAPLLSLMHQAGMTEWRVGVGRWEFGTQLLPTLTDGTPCTIALPQMAAPVGTTDLDLIAARDWFTYTDGTPVALAATADDTRYQLSYVRSVIDVATAFGVAPYVDIDLMPRALAASQTPVRTNAEYTPGQCGTTFTNKVSNVKPADATVFAAAVVGLVERVVEGSAGAPGRPVRYWEFWNEPELAYAWDPNVGDLTSWFQTADFALTALDNYRRTTASSDGRAIKIGLGSFANADAAATVVAQFPGPFDFLSFHVEISDDPLTTAQKIREVVAARDASSHASDELVLSEWAQQLVPASSLDPSTMDVALYDATVLALAATAGLDHAHHAIFWDFLAQGVPDLGIIDHDFTPRPAFYTFALLAKLIGGGAQRLAVSGFSDGELDGGMGAVLAAVGADGTTRILFVNRNTSARTASVGATPSAVTVFDDPTRAPHDASPSAIVAVPARSIVLVEL